MLTEPHVIKDICKLQSIELAKQGIELAKSLLALVGFISNIL
jgi:hypothetical protein